MSKVIFADEQDDITSIRTKLEGVDEPEVAVVVPKGNRSLVSPVALRLLRRQAEAMSLDVSLVTANPTLKRAAREEGLRVFGSPRAYQRVVDHVPGPVDHVRETTARFFGRVSALVTTVFALGIALFAVGLVYVFLPVATVTVVPQSQVIAGTVPVVVDPSGRGVDLERGRVPARVVYLLVDATDQMVPGDGRESQPGRAAGVVVFTNRSAQETIIPSGTVVSTSSGVRFRTSEEVRLAPGLGNTARVGVVAIDPGTGGNVGRLQITRVEGLLGSYALVTNEDPTAGGGAQAVPIVTTADRERLQARAMDRARQEAQAKLAALPAKREMLVQESIEFTPLEVSFDQEVGQQARMLNVRLKARAAGTVVSLDDVEEVARHAWRPAPPPGFTLGPNGPRMSTPAVSKVDGRVVTLAAKLEATTQAQVNVARVQQYARWRNPAEAERAIAEAFTLVRPPSVRIDPIWAERAYRVRVVVDVGAGS